MRFIHLYLIGYFVLVFGAGLALWRAGILQHVAPVWIGLAAVVVCGLGLLLAISSAPSRTPAAE